MTVLDQDKLDPRRRDRRPERINIGDDEFVRNDIIANEQGVSERTLNRDDRNGAPFALVGGVKYRPIRRYREYLAKRIQVKNQPPRRRRAHGTI
jgi:hypothetical protein